MFKFDFRDKAAFEKAMQDSLAAVSYTHLRAHETVLDIVCRLLLEKKKRKKMSLINTRMSSDLSSLSRHYIPITA